MPELQFKGKEFVYNHHLSVPFRPLVPDAAKSVGEPSLNGNLIIHGDNLHALKALLPMYAGKVDCIFIDPPYNTGNEGWSYNDNVNSPMMKEWLSSNPINGEDMLRHDKWCAMMWPRLVLLRELLSTSGIIFITIDDHEGARLEVLMEEIFGENNNLGRMVVQMNPKGRHLDNFFAKTHEYVLIFSKDIESVVLGGMTKDERMQAEYNEEDEQGRYRAIELRNRNSAFNPTTRAGLYYPIYVNPANGRVSLTRSEEFTAEALPHDARNLPTCWTWSPRKVEVDKKLLLGRQTREGVWRVFRKDYLLTEEGEEATTKPKTVWLDRDLNMDTARKSLRSMFSGDNVFDFPKPRRLVEKLLELLPDDDAIILDSFAGSGTTGHAVLQANANDGGNRRFVLVEGEAYADTLTAERLRRTALGYDFVGVQRDDLYSVALSWKKLQSFEKVIATVAEVVEQHKDLYDTIKTSVADGKLVVTGETKIHERAEGIGGGFTYCTLGEPLNLDQMLTGEVLPDYLTLGAWLFHTATGEVFSPAEADEGSLFLGESSAYYCWLVYKPELAFLKSTEAALTLSLAERIAAAKPKGKKHLVFAPAKYVPNNKLLPMGVEYAPLPFALYRIERG